MKFRSGMLSAFTVVGLLPFTTLAVAQSGSEREESQAVVLMRALPTLSENHSIGIIELDPESENFGKLLAEYEQPDIKHPMHHLYYSPNGRLYSTGLDPNCSLAEIGLARGRFGYAFNHRSGMH